MIDNRCVAILLISALLILYVLCRNSKSNMTVKDLHKEIKGFTKEEIKGEFSEQEMAFKYINPNDVVLEFGGNIGRVSMIIAKKLNNSKNLVVVESDPDNAKRLRNIRDINKENFHIIEGAVTEHDMIQKGWDVKYHSPLKKVPSGWKTIPTISLYNLPKLSYNTLVFDCEGCYVGLFKEYPHLLNGITTIIIENDANSYEDRQKLLTMFKNNGFKSVYRKKGGNHFEKTKDEYFYEVYRR